MWLGFLKKDIFPQKLSLFPTSAAVFEYFLLCSLITFSFNGFSWSIMQSSTYRYREFPVSGIFHFFGGIGTGIGKNWYRKKVSEPVSEKFGTGKSTGIGIGKNLVPELNFVAQILEF